MTLLPNRRLLGLSSASEGRDWNELIRRIDLQLEEENFDLAEETILIEFKKGEATVFRPVIGGLKVPHLPFVLEDRVSSQVEMKPLHSEFWDEILDEVRDICEKKGTEEFTLVMKRRMERELKLSVEVFFSSF